VVAAGKLYLYTVNNELYFLNSDTGNTLWAFSIPYILWHSSPVYANGKVYMGIDLWVHCYDAETGSKIWESKR
jgi:outer membrane protein assembly factor BamB